MINAFRIKCIFGEFIERFKDEDDVEYAEMCSIDGEDVDISIHKSKGYRYISLSATLDKGVYRASYPVDKNKSFDMTKLSTFSYTESELDD